jgi:hypothetical protein
VIDHYWTWLLIEMIAAAVDLQTPHHDAGISGEASTVKALQHTNK